MVLVASAIFVTGVIVLAQQRSEPEGLPAAGGPLSSPADPMPSLDSGEIGARTADSRAAGGACQSRGEAQILCLAELKQAARLVANEDHVVQHPQRP